MTRPPASSSSAVCLHHNDADGRACAAIARRALGPTLVLHEMDYGDPLPWQLLEHAAQVIVVDFSLPQEEMLQLAQGRELVWIDHHKTSLEALQRVSEAWPGIRSFDEAACVLAWHYFFPGQPVPQAVILIGDRDIWRWAEPQTGPFGEGLFHKDTDPANDQLWIPLLDDDPQAVAQLVAEGALLRDAGLVRMRRKVRAYGFPVLFEGWRTLVVNDRGSGEMGAFIADSGYQIGYCYIDNIQDGVVTTFVTLYSAEIDVSEIARRFGGGGHPGAAGFSFPRREIPFPPGAEVQPA